VTHPTPAHAATEHGATTHSTVAHSAAAHSTVAHSAAAHPTTVPHSAAAPTTTVAAAPAPTPTSSGRRIKRRTGDDGRRGGQGDHCFAHHDCVLQLATQDELFVGTAPLDCCASRALRLRAKISTTESIGQDCDTLK
jgi:hypothetical protein